MRKVLIVSPHFPPTNAPDMQRVRLALPHLRALGWEPVVLAIHPDSIEGDVRDALFERTYPGDIRIVRVRGIVPKNTRRFGFGGLWLRCGRAVREAGEALLRAEKFDLVFISTTQFDAFTLGPRWKRRFGVPFVVDYQDPWFTDYYARTGTTPPGGRIKFAFAQLRARLREPVVLREASGIVAVSSAYGLSLARTYPGFDASRVVSLPFGTSEDDLAHARSHVPAQPLVPFGDGCFHHVYAGRAGADMGVSLAALFRAFGRYQTSHPVEAARMRFHFIGTSYAPPPLGRETVMPIARAEGVGAHVREHCERVPYFDALHYVIHADALVLLGSDDPSYSASKIFPYLFSRRPALTVFHEQSPALAVARLARSGPCLGFAGKDDIDTLADEIHARWFVAGGMAASPGLLPPECAGFSAEAMTRQLAAIFSAAILRP